MDDFSYVLENLADAMVNAVTILTEGVKKMGEELPILIMKVKKDLKDMRNEDFEKFLENIQDNGARELAIKWRNEGKDERE